jgi:hypothetical protein
MNGDYAGVEYTNILADITIGKNFEVHYNTVTERIEGLNRSIDHKRKMHEECNWMVGICYQYYRLQQLIRIEFKNR